MVVVDEVKVMLEGKGEYENCLDDYGAEHEWLNGVGLGEGCYCKHFRWERDWSDRSSFGEDGKPAPQHYCSSSKVFLGWGDCCSGFCQGFEKGKSAGLQRIRIQIHNKRFPV